jgi:hypothetical protein
VTSAVTDHTEQIEQISLLASLEQRWIKLPLACMQDVGPAAQTLGGLLRESKRETFSAVSAIAERALLPVVTVRRHLITLHNAGWIVNAGREKTRRGAPRRTCTIRVTQKSLAAMGEWGVLPWWACCKPRKGKSLNWSESAILSVVMSRLMTLKATVCQQDAETEEDVIDAIENLGGENRFKFAMESCLRSGERGLTELTGLSRRSIIDAKASLVSRGIISIEPGYHADGGSPPHLLVPNWDFRVKKSPAGDGYFYLDFVPHVGRVQK